ncbi:MAG: exo-beta-N-acetylmuramidase NamZ domain-containing protein, partial [Candidatus Poribacteria bacterium]|nr:exo-beta-N-acetylmuramidase NamZ domain-containing protein [Candidatus Poribacteria bacterium]
MIQLGLNLLLNGKQDIINQRQVGLITNQTGVNENLDCNVDLLSAFCYISTLFSPEHGFFGNARDGQKINSSIDKRHLIPIHSLYADKRKPTQEMVDGLDMLIYDIQDVGSRFYTYLSTLFLSMETASEYGIDFVVLDRPNPISGILVEGNILDTEFQSFVGPHPTP